MTDCSSEVALTLDVLILCFNRQSELNLAIASCDFQEINAVHVLDNASEIPIEVQSGVSLIRSEENLGPCTGRNWLALNSSADLFLFLDDDAVLNRDIDLTAIIHEFSANTNLSIVAGLMKREDGQVINMEFPARSVSEISRSREVGYYIEGACIIRRNDFLSLGGYDSNFFYGHEGTDFSLKVAKSGKQIFYDPRLAFIHKPSSNGRSLTINKYSRQLRNRRILAWRNLPRPVAFLHVSIWLAYYVTRVWAKKPADIIHLIIAAYSPIKGQEREIKRSPLPYKKLNYLQKIGYRIYW
jgi:GT2 family glycosyltransferase